MALTSAQRVELIQKMYVAYYGRPADPIGSANWVNYLANNNDNAQAIVEAFGTSPEAVSLYGNPVNYAEAVNNLYMQMFNRPAEPAGLQAWVLHLEKGLITLPMLALEIAMGAQGGDKATFLNKVEVAAGFTAAIATSTENILGYAGEDAAAHAAAFLASVTSEDGSVVAASASLVSIIDTIIGLDQLSSLPTHTLTTGLDNLLGTNGNDVVLAVLDGDDSTLELDDAFNALMGQDTLRLDAVEDGSDVNFNSNDYHMVGFERVLVQARADDLNIDLDLSDMVGVDLEVRNMVGDNAELGAFSVDGDVLVVNFDGNRIDINDVGGDVALREIDFDDAIYVNGIAGSVSLIDGYSDDEDTGFYLADIGGDFAVTDTYFDFIEANGVAGDVTMTDVNANDNINLFNIGGDITLTDVDANDNLNVIFASDVAHGTINLENVWIDYELHINGANTLDANDNITTVAGSLTSVTLNVSGEEGLDANGIELTSYEDESDEQSNITSLTINANGDVSLDYIDFADDADGNDVTTSLTINGAGEVDLGEVYEDDVLNVVYTGSGSLNIESWEPVDGSFNASTATGDVTVELDLGEEVGLDFTYTGSKGADRVIIDVETLGAAAANEETIAVSLAGGAGTDTLVIGDDDDLSEEAMAAVSGFEVLELTDLDDDETFDLSDAHEFTSVVVDGTTATDETVSVVGLSATQAQNISVNFDGYDGNGFDDLTIALENSVGIEDVVSLSLVADTNVPNGEFEIDETLTIEEVETINITAVGGAYDENTQDWLVSFNGMDAQANAIADLEDIVAIEEDDVAAARADLAEAIADEDGEGIDAAEAELNTQLAQLATAQANLDSAVDALAEDQRVIDLGTLINIDDVDANEMETLNISGASSLDIENIDANDLRVIDARGFTGAFLGLGTDGNINTNDDLVIHGSLTADHDIDVDGQEDVTITTGSGQDNIYVDFAGDDVVVNSGAGNDTIYIDYVASGDVVINAGSGNDGVNIDYVYGDVTVSLGDGDDNFNYNYNDTWGDLVVDGGAGDDNINIHLYSEGVLESATVTLGSGADELWLEDTRWDASNDVVVTVTDFAVAQDILYFDESVSDEVVDGVDSVWSSGAAYTTVGTQDGDYDVTDGIANDQIGVVEFTFDADNNDVMLDIDSTGADLLEALGDDGDTAIITVNEDQEGYIVAYNGGNAYIFNFEDQSGTDPSVGIDVGDYDDGYYIDDDEYDYEDMYISIATGTEGFADGDYITFNNILDSGTFVYYIEGVTNVDTLGANIASAINALSDRAYNVSYNSVTDELYLVAEAAGNLATVSATYFNADDTETIDAGEIELIGVLENVAVGSLSTANFGFYGWDIS